MSRHLLVTKGCRIWQDLATLKVLFFFGCILFLCKMSMTPLSNLYSVVNQFLNGTEFRYSCVTFAFYSVTLFPVFSLHSLLKNQYPTYIMLVAVLKLGQFMRFPQGEHWNNKFVRGTARKRIWPGPKVEKQP